MCLCFIMILDAGCDEIHSNKWGTDYLQSMRWSDEEISMNRPITGMIIYLKPDFYEHQQQAVVR